MSLPGGYNDMWLEQINDQIKNINKILRYFDIELHYGVVYAQYQIVAGTNYNIIIKHYKSNYSYSLEYFVDLNKKISGSLHKLTDYVNSPTLCIVKYKCKCKW